MASRVHDSPWRCGHGPCCPSSDHTSLPSSGQLPGHRLPRPCGAAFSIPGLAVNDAVRTQLRQIVVTYGLEICEDPRRVEALLRDLAAGHRREIAVLVGAVREGVPSELLAAKNRVLPAVLGDRLVRMLQDNLGLADEVARWAVSTWASALDVTGLALSDAGPIPQPRPSARHESGAIKISPSRSLARPPVGIATAGPEAWLTLGYRGHAPVLSDTFILATGLEPSDEEALVVEALTRRSTRPPVLICEGPETRSPGGRPMVHYDMTGRCREAHAHVFFDPALSSSGQAAEAAVQLLYLSYPNVSRIDLIGLLGAVLWAAGAAGLGVRAAMDWLASDQLAEVAAYCRSIFGPDPPRFVHFLEDLINGPGPARQEAVYAAWQALAPVEAIIRSAANTPGAQRLDFDAWPSADAILAISLPTGAGVAGQQILNAVLKVSNFQGDRPASARGSRVWRDMPRPLHDYEPAVGWTLAAITESSRFRDWAGLKIRGDLLLGAHADAESLALASAIAQRPLAAPSPGQVMVVRNGAVELLSAHH